MEFYHSPSFDDIQQARSVLESELVKTPLLRAEFAEERTKGGIWLKAESLQYTGSFKARGALNRIERIPFKDRGKGVVAFSSGNHGIGVARAAFRRGLPATLVIPEDAPENKVRRMRRWRPEILRYRRDDEDREEIARLHAVNTGATLIKPYDDPYIIAGQGTIGIELLEQAEEYGIELDGIVVPCGGGGLITGIGLAASVLSPQTKIYAVEPRGFEDAAHSLEQKRRVANPSSAWRENSLLCDALLAVEPGEITFPLMQKFIERSVSVCERDVLQAMDWAFTRLKLVLEPSGSVGLAAVLFGELSSIKGNVAIIGSGGNVDSATFSRAFSLDG